MAGYGTAECIPLLSPQPRCFLKAVVLTVISWEESRVSPNPAALTTGFSSAFIQTPDLL